MSMTFRKAGTPDGPLLMAIHTLLITQQCLSIPYTKYSSFTSLSEFIRPVFSRISFPSSVGDVSWNILLEDGCLAEMEATVFPHPPLSSPADLPSSAQVRTTKPS